MGKSSPARETLPGTILSPHQVEPLSSPRSSKTFSRDLVKPSRQPHPDQDEHWDDVEAAADQLEEQQQGQAEDHDNQVGVRFNNHQACLFVLVRVPTIDQSDVDFVYGDDIQLQLIGTTSTSDGSSE